MRFLIGIFVLLCFVAPPAMASCGSFASAATSGSMVLSLVQGAIGTVGAGNSVDGQLVYDASQKKLKFCAGNAWASVVPEGNATADIAVSGVMKAAGGFATSFERLGFYQFSSNVEAPEMHTQRWLHLKTNQIMDSRMVMIEFVGYEYRNLKIIDARISYYPYSVTGLITNKGSSGTHSTNVYKSADGYAVLAIQIVPYHVGFVLNQYSANPAGMFNVDITGNKWADSNEGAY